MSIASNASHARFKALLEGCKQKFENYAVAFKAPAPQLPYQSYPRIAFPEISAEEKQIYPGYDEALAIIAKHKLRCESEIGQLQARCTEEEKSDVLEKIKELRDLQAKYDPELIYRIRHDDLDYSNPVHLDAARFIFEDFRKLRIKQRFTQMTVTPDLCPDFDPILDVYLYLQPEQDEIEPGEKVPPSWAWFPPRLSIVPYDGKTRKLTILVCDPDTPDFDRLTFRTKLLFGVSNIANSITTPQTHFDEGTIWAPYEAPYFLEKSPNHRISILVCEEPESFTFPNDVNRENFDSYDFFNTHSLKVVGGSMYRIGWDNSTESFLEEAGIPYPKYKLKQMSADEAVKKLAAEV